MRGCDPPVRIGTLGSEFDHAHGGIKYGQKGSRAALSLKRGKPLSGFAEKFESHWRDQARSSFPPCRTTAPSR